MGFNRFRVGVFIRVILLGLTVSGAAILISDPSKIISAIILIGISMLILAEIFRYVEKTNRKLTRFLESVRYSDFISGFTSDNKLGQSFADLNQEFNDVLEAFRVARGEKEEHWQYLNTVVQHVTTGLLSFDEEGNVELINARTKQFFGSPQLRNIEELKDKQPELHRMLINLKPGINRMLRLNSNVHLAIHATELKLRGKIYKLVSLQNIQSELQQKEVEAWQNLTRVLRHEIMNSITPISSLTSTLNEILVEDLVRRNNKIEILEETIDDLEEGLNTIKSRSTGLIRFVEAYRDYTTIPAPKLKEILLHELLEHIANLHRAEIRKGNVKLTIDVKPEDLVIFADEELIHLVLINLVKNSIEATGKVGNPRISLKGSLDFEQKAIIEITDNGEGIIQEAMERIFVPFYTTKKTGSGIGLALSRQIMQLHNGTISAESTPGSNTTFTLRFN